MGRFFKKMVLELFEILKSVQPVGSIFRILGSVIGFIFLRILQSHVCAAPSDYFLPLKMTMQV